MSSARLAIISWAPYPILAMLRLHGQECFLAENCSPPWYQRHLLLKSQVKLLASLLSLDDAYMNFSAVKLFSCLHKQKLPKSLLLARRMSITSETILKGCVRYTKTSSSHHQPSHLKSFVINSRFDTVFENHFKIISYFQLTIQVLRWMQELMEEWLSTYLKWREGGRRPTERSVFNFFSVMLANFLVLRWIEELIVEWLHLLLLANMDTKKLINCFWSFWSIKLNAKINVG